jgi:8-oxo-dGTP pyrophosphatase MutT (NUDIX family)
MQSNSHTHSLSVNAFLVCNDHFLLLKRAHDPLIWAPPGGHLLPDEDPLKGLQREIFEETSLNAEIFYPVVTWFGKFKGGNLLSIDYWAKTSSMSVVLSDEHIDYRWLSIQQLIAKSKIYFNSTLGFTLNDFFLAWKSYLMQEKRFEELVVFASNLRSINVD